VSEYDSAYAACERAYAKAVAHCEGCHSCCRVTYGPEGQVNELCLAGRALAHHWVEAELSFRKRFIVGGCSRC